MLRHPGFDPCTMPTSGEKVNINTWRRMEELLHTGGPPTVTNTGTCSAPPGEECCSCAEPISTR
ncbi:protein CLEC16A isoform X6 [Anopheles sinensis]|uniref:Protein CLEC16A isoform X6 n=1 Tax=Anopheles sinensis TaxID=74873 RepID=A0A084W2T8_ANOSI|nr:protein CLEC16A isoform X6 [Anopheles sinensis]